MRRTTAGFSLIVSLIILTMLSILVASFLTSTGLDRATAHAFLDRQRAELAADTAANQAMSMLREYITEFPDSVTAWEPLDTPADLEGAHTTTEGTMLYYYDRPPPSSGTTSSSTPPKRYFLPLMSRGVDAHGRLLGPVPIEYKSTALGSDPWVEDTMKGKVPNCIDLNRARFNGDTAGWIGSPPPPAGATAPIIPKPFRARWIDVKETGTAPGVIPRIIGRYAFWIEDESFKLNLNALDNHLTNFDASTGRGVEVGATGESSRLDTDKPLAPQFAGLVPIQGLFTALRTPQQLDRDVVAGKVRTSRDGLAGRRFPDLRAFNQVPLSYAMDKDQVRYPLGDQAKFLATAFSGALNLSRHGSQRLSLNGLGFDNLSATNTEIEKQLQQVVEAIKWHAPKFGQRFYRLRYKGTDAADEKGRLNADQLVPEPVGGMQPWAPDFGSVTATHADIYLYKVATNIRDYIDPDFQPTLVDSSGKVAPRARMEFALSSEGPNRYFVQGKDSAPFIQEVVERFRTETNGRNYHLRVDYYIELWNMTGRDIKADDLGPNPFLRVNYAIGWASHPGTDPLTGTPAPEEGHPCRLNLGGLGIVFRAGACTVITSNPDLKDWDKEFVLVPPYNLPPYNDNSTARTTRDYRAPLSDGTTFVYSIPLSHQVGAREFRGPLPTGKDGFWPTFRETQNSNPPQEDYQTEVVFGNDYGVLDSHPFAVSKGGGANVTYTGGGTSRANARDDTFGGTLRGNSSKSDLTAITPSQLGDPRTNNEQLRMKRYQVGGDPDQTRYFNPAVNDDARFSLGWPNARYVVPHLNSNTYTTPHKAPYGFPWPDYYKVWPMTDGKSAVVLNADTDTAPAFVLNGPLTSIGQLGDVFDPARVMNPDPNSKFGIEGARGGGRTLKIGQPDDLVDMSSPTAASCGWAAWRLTDFFSTTGELALPGVININGLCRDNGAALRAACYGMKLRAVTSSAAASTPNVVPSKDLVTDEAATGQGLQVLIDAALTRLKTSDPFVERGELSEFPFFNSTEQLVPAVPMQDAFDRTREELTRRLLELVTTRGNIFSVYAIGQSIIESPDAKRTQRVTATHEVKTTFALIPKKSDGTDFKVAGETFDPRKAAAVRERFAAPHHYDIQILQVNHL